MWTSLGLGLGMQGLNILGTFVQVSFVLMTNFFVIYVQTQLYLAKTISAKGKVFPS